jgi:hypothetical protein
MKKTVILHGKPFNGGELRVDSTYLGPREFYEPAGEREANRLDDAFPVFPDIVEGGRPGTATSEDDVCFYAGISKDKRSGIGVYYRPVTKETYAEFVDFDDDGGADEAVEV